jgi:hypothetical protein
MLCRTITPHEDGFAASKGIPTAVSQRVPEKVDLSSLVTLPFSEGIHTFGTFVT